MRENTWKKRLTPQGKWSTDNAIIKYKNIEKGQWKKKKITTPELAYRASKIDWNKIRNHFEVTVTVSIFSDSPPTNTTKNASKGIIKYLTICLFRDNIEDLKRKQNFIHNTIKGSIQQDPGACICPLLVNLDVKRSEIYYEQGP